LLFSSPSDRSRVEDIVAQLFCGRADNAWGSGLPNLGLNPKEYGEIAVRNTVEGRLAQAAFVFGSSLVTVCNDPARAELLHAFVSGFPEAGLKELIAIVDGIEQDAGDTDDDLSARGARVGRFAHAVYRKMAAAFGAELGALFEALSTFVYSLGTQAGVFRAIREHISELAATANLPLESNGFVERLAGACSAAADGDDEPGSRLLDDFRTWANKEFARNFVFLCYEPGDDLAARTVADLDEQAGWRAFMGNRGSQAGEDWEEDLRRALSRADELFVLLTPGALKSAWVTMEAGAAWVLRKPVTPVLSKVQPDDVPEFFRRFPAHSVDTAEGRETFLESLTRHPGAGVAW
jgi:hypothetical protein